MKKLIPLMFLLFIGNAAAQEHELYGKFYGQFTCSVESSHLAVSEEGELLVLGGYFDSFGFQDKVKITYFISNALTFGHRASVAGFRRAARSINFNNSVNSNRFSSTGFT